MTCLGQHDRASGRVAMDSRHPQLTLRAAMPLSQARALMRMSLTNTAADTEGSYASVTGQSTDENVINQYFDTLEDTLVENDIFDDPHCIYNLDETGMPLNPKSQKVVDAVGAKNPSYITGQTKTQITVLAHTSAAGSTLPPFVIFDRQTLNPGMVRGEVPGTIYGLSSKGWIKQELFLFQIPSLCPFNTSLTIASGWPFIALLSRSS